MAMAIDRGAGQIRVLSDLSGGVLGALLDEEIQETSAADPFSAALRSYIAEGPPMELGRRWRRASGRAAAGSPATDDRAVRVLRLLARDLLACVATPPASGSTTEAEDDLPPPNVRSLRAGPTVVPALELAGDGTWRPSGSQIASGEEPSAHRPAHVPSLVSRYPGAADAPRTHVVLPASPLTRTIPPPPPSAPAPIVIHPPPPAIVAPTIVAAAPTVVAEPPPAPPVDEPVERVATSAESVIQAVSGALEIVAGPFDRFQQLAGFVKALRGVRGVNEVTTRQFVRGTVTLRIRYSDPIAFSDRLGALAEFAPEIVSSSQKRIELRVRPPEDVPPARK